MYNLYIEDIKTTDFGAPYHFRVCAKMVWGRSISTADTKRAPDFSEALRGCLCLLEQLLLDFGNLDVDAFVHKVDKVEQYGHVRHAEKVVFAVAVLY